jgi:hypothetical protein
MDLNVCGIDLEIQHQEYWLDDKIIFYSNPHDKKYEIIQYLYNEGFIQDRRTPYIIKELK